jgi:type III secretion protein J
VRRIALALLLAAGCGVELEHGLDERQANQVAAVLDQAGIAADKVAEEGLADRYKIVVPRADQARAFQLLESRDLPRRGQKGLADAFAASTILPSAVEERARYAAAVAVDLERTLEALPGVTAARVHVALPPEELVEGEGPRPRPTASVLLKAQPTYALGDLEVKKLVAGAVHTLQPADVSVVVAREPDGAPAPEVARLGPTGARTSRATLATLAASGLLVIILLGLAVAWTSLRLLSLRKRLRDLESPPRA